MRLIDGLSLWAEMKRLEELARNRYLDTPSSSPVHERYSEQMRERTSLKEMISAMPTIEAVPVAHGRWKDMSSLDEKLCKCSMCGYPISYFWGRSRYCPSCGAKMDLEA